MTLDPFQRVREAKIELDDAKYRQPTNMIGRVIQKVFGGLEISYREARLIRAQQDLTMRNAGVRVEILPMGDMSGGYPVFTSSNDGPQK